MVNFGTMINLAVAYWACNTAYVNYFKNSEGKLDTVTRLAKDVITMPYQLISAAIDQGRLAQECQKNVHEAKINNFLNSGFSYLQNVFSNGAKQIDCDIETAKAKAYSGAAVIGSLVYCYVAAPYVKAIVSASLPLCKQLGSKLYSLLPSLPAKTDRGCFEEPLKEFEQIHLKLKEKILFELGEVVLKGDTPAVELKTDLLPDKILAILKEEGVELASLDMSAEGQCTKIHLKTVSKMDLCLTFKA